MTEQEKKYFAFISYKREDEKWARWLQHELEHYRLPLNVRKTNSGLPKEIRPIFKDTSDLAAGVLVDEIQRALEQSKYLIVICSPRSSKSEWVGKEVQSFINMGREKDIIPFIIGGKPFAENPDEECFPLALRQLSHDKELLGVNINEVGRNAAVIKTVARMFGLEFDVLWQRREREQRRKLIIVLAAVTAFVLAVIGLAFWMYLQRQKTLKANWKMMENQARMVAEKSKDEVAKGNTFDAIIALLEMTPQDGSRPFVPELEVALRMAYDSLQFKKWNYRHIGSYMNKLYFSEDEKYIIGEDLNRIDIFESKTMNKLSEISIPDSLASSRYETILSHNNEMLYCVNGDSVDCYSTLDGKFKNRLPFSKAIFDLWINTRKSEHSIGTLLGHWSFVEKWWNEVKLPESADVIDYCPIKQYVLYVVNDESVLRLYDCKRKSVILSINYVEMFPPPYMTSVCGTSFSPNGNLLAISFENGPVGIIVDLNDNSISRFDCGNYCSDNFNSLAFGNDNQLLHYSREEKYVKMYDAQSFLPVDSIKVSCTLGSQMNSDGSIWLVNDEQEWYAYYKQESAMQKKTINRQEKTKYMKEAGFEVVDWQWEKTDTIINQRYKISMGYDGIHITDLSGKYKSWQFVDEQHDSNIWGAFHDNKYLVVGMSGRFMYSNVEYSVCVVDLESGIVVKQIMGYYGPKNIYYNKETEQLAFVEFDESDNNNIDISFVPFPSIDKLVSYCRDITKGMKLDDKRRRTFYLD